MKASIPTILTFATPLLIVATAYYLIVNFADRSRIKELSNEDPLLIQYVDFEIGLDPMAEFWKETIPARIDLFPQTVRVPYGTEEREIWVRGIYNDREIAFHIEFTDSTRNAEKGSIPDACAILLVPESSPATAQMMGHAASANIWHWLANQDESTQTTTDAPIPSARELIASGPGTQTPLPGQNVSGMGVYDDNRWLVTLSRQLRAQQRGETSLLPGRGCKIAFAVWDGNLKESFSRKSIAILRDLRLEAQ